MMLDDSLNLYEVLELSSLANSQEIRAAYLRAKAAYRKDSVALYSLLSGDETERLLQRIEEAYQILSHPDKRRDYDRKNGLNADGIPAKSAPIAARPFAPVVSIDRVPPMDSSFSEDELLLAPKTDFAARPETGTLQNPLSAPVSRPTALDPFPEPAVFKPHARELPHPGLHTPSVSLTPFPLPAAHPTPPHVQSSISLQADLQASITQETEWRGSFLRRIREGRRVSIEEMADSTKISRSYLVAIEEENFSRLPAPVYLRGFLLQYARYLRLPQEAAASAYLARYHQSKGRAQ